jgi:hypothetical protein
MMHDVFEVADILVSHATADYGDEIGIIVYCGSYAKGTATATSDLDLYYIPDEGKAASLASTFVIDGLPYDFWGPPWKMLEEIANARSRRPWAVSASLVADTKVLYARSQEDLARFNALKARIQELIQPESRGYMVERALDEFRTTLFQLGQMRLANTAGDMPGLHWAGWKFASSAVNCLALVNQVYFSKGWGSNIAQILQMAQKPDDLEALLNGILQPVGPVEILANADRLASEVRAILRAAQDSLAEPSPPQEIFKDFYYYVHEYKNKVLGACQKSDVLAASSAAFHLQELICVLMNKVEAGFYGVDFNLLGEYLGGYQKAGFPDLLEPASTGDLETLTVRVDLLDTKIKNWFEQYSIDLNILKSTAELKDFLYERDPRSKEEQ